MKRGKIPQIFYPLSLRLYSYARPRNNVRFFMTKRGMKKIRKPTKIEIDVHQETGGQVNYEQMLYGSAYPHYDRNPKAPAYKGKCTFVIKGQEIELDLAIWKRDYGLSLTGTRIHLSEGKGKREY